MNDLIDFDSPSILFNVTPKPVAVTTKDIGVQLACDYTNKQAEVLAHWAAEIAAWPSANGTWAFQCRGIAECLSDDQCRSVASILELLIEHLHAIPVERKSARITDSICNAVKSIAE